MEPSKINITTTTVREEEISHDLQELPPELRRACEEELAKHAGGARVVRIEGTERIIIDGKEYAGVDDMPDNVRRKHEQLMESLKACGNQPVAAEITFNGHKYSSAEEMPAGIRREYERLLALIGDRGPSRPAEETAGVPVANEQANYFYCRHCGKVVKAMESQGGMQGKCPCCGEMTGIPYVSTAESADAAKFVDTGAVHRHRHV